MQITLFTLLMSVLWSSALAAFNYFCRKKQYFIRQLGIINIIVLYLFSTLRMVVPYKFTFTKVIHSGGAFSDLGTDIYPSFMSIAAIIWAAGSAVLIARFICRYVKAVKEFSTYGIREDEQCRRIFHQVLNESKKQIQVNIRHSAYINIPMGVGIFAKSIILPKEEYSDSELYYILKHEYTHFQNRDLIIKILVHIYRCIFWWNPAVYLSEKELARILEIRCDLDVTGNMENLDKARYLSTIVTMLKNAGAKRAENEFCGVTALVTGNHEPEIIERFRIVSAGYVRKKRNILFSGAWIFIFGLLIFISSSFVVQAEYTASANGTVTETETDNSYSVKCIDNTYYVYFHK